MASLLNLFVAPIGVISPQRRVRTLATAAKSSSGGSTSEEDKGILDFVLGKIAKQDQFYETDPILNKVVEDKSATGRSKNSVVVPPPPPPAKKEGGFGGLGGLFAKK